MRGLVVLGGKMVGIFHNAIYENVFWKKAEILIFHLFISGHLVQPIHCECSSIQNQKVGQAASGSETREETMTKEPKGCKRQGSLMNILVLWDGQECARPRDLLGLKRRAGLQRALQRWQSQQCSHQQKAAYAQGFSSGPGAGTQQTMRNAWLTVLSTENIQGAPRSPFSTPPKHPAVVQYTCRAETGVKKTYTAMGQLGTFLPAISHIYPSSI